MELAPPKTYQVVPAAEEHSVGDNSLLRNNSLVEEGSTLSQEDERSSLVDANSLPFDTQIFRRAASEESNSPLHKNINHSHLHRVNSSMDDSEWDDDDDDLGLRRYHLDFTSTVPTLPAEFEAGTTLPERIYFYLRRFQHLITTHWTNLRTAARQRQAARLLSMPNQRLRYKLTACLMTYCCDATDAGICLALTSVGLWLFLGTVLSVSSTYWNLGILLILIRVSARRLYEYLDSWRRRTLSRPRTSSTDEQWKPSLSDHQLPTHVLPEQV